MIGRYRDLDLNREVSKWAREQVGDGLLIAEHGHDFRPDLGARGWHGVMNYSGFLRPLWTWLIRDDPDPEQQEQFWGIPVGVPSLDGEPSVAALRRFRAGVPWESVLHSWNLLDSHDTARFRTIAGTRRAAPRRRRAADDAARACRCSSRATSSGSRAPGARTHGAPCPGTREETWDTDVPRAGARARRAAPLERARSPAAASATCTCRPTRSPSCARRATSSCSCSRRAPRTSRSRLRSAHSKRCTATTPSTASCPPTAPHSTSGGFVITHG